MDTMHGLSPSFAELDVRPDALLDQAAAVGFTLATFVTSSGQTVYEWRRGDEPRPQFATERVARLWMAEWLDRPAADPAGSGRSGTLRPH